MDRKPHDRKKNYPAEVPCWAKLHDGQRPHVKQKLSVGRALLIQKTHNGQKSPTGLNPKLHRRSWFGKSPCMGISLKENPLLSEVPCWAKIPLQVFISFSMTCKEYEKNLKIHIKIRSLGKCVTWNQTSREILRKKVMFSQRTQITGKSDENEQVLHAAIAPCPTSSQYHLLKQE